MRKPRDYVAELKALDQKARHFKECHIRQLGELVIATGADTLPVEELAGALLAAIAMTDTPAREAWRKSGAAFFRGAARARSGARLRPDGVETGNGSTPSHHGEPGAS